MLVAALVGLRMARVALYDLLMRVDVVIDCPKTPPFQREWSASQGLSQKSKADHHLAKSADGQRFFPFLRLAKLEREELLGL